MYSKFREFDLAELRRVLRYDPHIGKPYWRVKPSPRIKAGAVAGCLSKSTGYILIKGFDVQICAHRVAWALYYGCWPSTLLDHRNRIKTDNRIKNLRPATIAQNSANSIRSPNKSGYRGVYREEGNKNWFASIKINGKNKNLGTFSDPKEAHEAYQRAARELHGEFACQKQV